MRYVMVVIGFAAALAFVSPAGAQDMRCDGSLVSVGLSQPEVEMKCGEPDFKQDVTVGDYGPKIEKWTYKQGSGSFLRILTFEGGELVNVQNGARQ